jgi:purine nucleosidase
VTTHRVILDTDIGSDVDDALALATLIGSPDVVIEGITTVYGDTDLRARLAKRLVAICPDAGDFPVLAGRRETFTERPVWWTGHEGSSFSDLANFPPDDGDAVEFLVQRVLANPDKIDILAIGPLTNIAAAIQADPAFATSVRSLVVMGGDFVHDKPEHNFVCDAEATRIVFTSRIKAVVVGLDVTETVDIDEAWSAGLAQTCGQLGRALDSEIRTWLAFDGHGWTNPHDATTVLALTDPDLFEFRDGWINITSQPTELAGASRLSPADSGVSPWHRAAVRVDVPVSLELILTRIRAASGVVTLS